MSPTQPILALAICALIGASAPGQAPAKKRRSTNAMQAYLPLAPGAQWEWQLSIDHRDPVPVTWRCVRQITVRKPAKEKATPEASSKTTESFWADELRDRQPDDNLCWEIRTIEGVQPSWQYWAARKDGIFKLKNQFTGAMRGVSPEQPTRLIPGPLGITSRWDWTEIGSVATNGRGGYPSKDELLLKFRGKLITMSESVEVPAGKFRAIRIEIERKNNLLGREHETIWIARGTGIVKRILYIANGQHSHVYELKSFTPGTVVRDTVRQRITKILTTDPVCVGLGKPTSLTPIQNHTLETMLGSRFFVAEWKESRMLFRDYEGKTIRFHAGQSKSWNLLVSQEFGTPSRTDGMMVAKCFGTLWSLYCRPDSRPEPVSSELRTTKNGTFDVAANLEITADGKRQKRWGRVWFAENQVVKIKSNVSPPQ